MSNSVQPASDAIKAEPTGLAPLSLRRNFSWTFVGNVVYAASQWGMLVAIAKIGTPEMVGQFALALAVTAPVIMLANLQLRSIQATDAKREYTFGDYLGLRLITTLLAVIFIVFISFFGGYRSETVGVIIVIGFSKAIESISDVYYGLLQQRERMDRIAKSMLIKGPLSLFVMIVFLLITQSVFWGAIGLGIGWLFLLISYDMRSARLLVGGQEDMSLQPSWNLTTLRKLIWLALPLGLVMMLISLNTAIPRYIIERVLGEASLGYYAAIAYLMVAARTIVAALGQSVTPRLSIYFAKHNNKAFIRLLTRLVGIGVLLGLGAVLMAVIIGEWLLALIYEPDYAAYNNVFILVMIASGLMSMASFVGYGMTAARRFREQLPLFIVVVASTVIAGLILIPSYELVGAAITLIISTFINLAFSMIVLIWAIRKNAVIGES